MATLDSQACWIVGYGNRQRRDDGIGPFVVDKLRSVLKREKEVRLLALPQLRVDVAEELREADLIWFVDATIDDLEGGWARSKLHPETQFLPYLTHHVHPSFLLALIEALYHRSPCAWLVSVQGCDFGFGNGLSPEAEKRAEEVSSKIIRLIDDTVSQNKDFKHRSISHGKRSRHPYY